MALPGMTTITSSRALALLGAGLVAVNNVQTTTGGSTVTIDHTPALRVMTRALATSAGSGSACGAEGQTCAVDDTCVDCVQSYGDAFADCAASFSSSWTTASSTDYCGVISDIVCCASEGCHDNGPFAATIGTCTTWAGCVCVRARSRACVLCVRAGGRAGGRACLFVVFKWPRPPPPPELVAPLHTSIHSEPLGVYFVVSLALGPQCPWC